MYQDSKPCTVCGAEVQLRSHQTLTVHEADDTIDERVCTNASCPTNTDDRGSDAPRP
ncbi:hypothetical protein ABLE68_00300 [Nocardioides sp. CN2-186]|uniref:hypothetical protein n=1 Tax=Nocardioides tweenelious TaxID=3156607 RepID=UPI0032B6179F